MSLKQKREALLFIVNRDFIKQEKSSVFNLFIHAFQNTANRTDTANFGPMIGKMLSLLFNLTSS